MSAIVDVIAREILDSRGNPTVEADVVLEFVRTTDGFTITNGKARIGGKTAGRFSSTTTGAGGGGGGAFTTTTGAFSLRK